MHGGWLSSVPLTSTTLLQLEEPAILEALLEPYAGTLYTASGGRFGTRGSEDSDFLQASLQAVNSRPAREALLEKGVASSDEDGGESIVSGPSLQSDGGHW